LVLDWRGWKKALEIDGEIDGGKHEFCGICLSRQYVRGERIPRRSGWALSRDLGD